MKLLTINNGTLYKYLYDGGYYSFDNNTPTSHYYNRDHLGNIREVIAENGTVEQVTHYYPFGTPYSDNSVTNPAFQPYKYNGKEFDAMHGLHTYDYGARQYDPLLVVWHGVDPLCEKDYRTGTSVYCMNNPVNFVDIDGKDAEVYIRGNTVIIAANIHIYGNGASASTAQLMQRNIMSFWNRNPQTGKRWTYTDAETRRIYKIVFDVMVDVYDIENPLNEPGVFSGKNNPFNRDNYIKVNKDAKRSYVNGGDEGEWRGRGRKGKSLSEDDSSVHEFGHLIGFGDRYTKNGVQKGWEGNIMAEPVMKGQVQQRNINALMKPIIDLFNSKKDKNEIEFKTSIDYDDPQY